MQGLKTGMYYLRTKAAANAVQFTVDKSKLGTVANTEAELKKEEEDNMAALMCSITNKEACLMCSS